MPTEPAKGKAEGAGGPAVPLPNVIYVRHNPYLRRSIYIRWEPGGRPYPEEIRNFDRRFSAGVFDWDTGACLDMPYSFEDQHAMFECVVDNFSLFRERAKHIGNLARKLVYLSEMGLVKSPWSEGPKAREALAKIRELLRKLDEILGEF
jgi:hypothetical protein